VCVHWLDEGDLVMKSATPLMLAAHLCFLLVACGDRDSTEQGSAGQVPTAATAEPATAATNEGMDMGPAPADAVHVAEGTVQSIDRAQGTVTIAHSPVESADWPAMTMSFKLTDAKQASALKTGDKVTFRFRTPPAGEPTITAITPVP
jgi:Cu(I)/Ag(I) efflux system protein CusF